jgi:hypothetical protein
MTNKELIEQIGTAAVKHYPTYRILPSMTIAQAILESNWGKSGLAKDCHNYFGMKWTSTCGTEYKEYSTQEQRKDKTWYTVKAKFRKYGSVTEGIKGYYDFLNYSRYRNLKGVTDYRESCILIKEDGWATDVSYTAKLTKLIKDNALWKYDLQAIYSKAPTGTINQDSSFLSIVWLQHNLNICLAGAKGFVSLVVDGDYGSKTRAAVLLYWKQLDWKPGTGWGVGVNTKKALAASRKK